VSENGWDEYQKLVMSDLKRLDKGINAINEKLDLLSRDVGMLKVKASMWGAAAGAIPVIGMLLFNELR